MCSQFTYKKKNNVHKYIIFKMSTANSFDVS